MDRPSVFVRAASESYESNAHAPIALNSSTPWPVNKKQRNLRIQRKKTAHDSTCDALMSHKTAATAMSRRLIQQIRIAQMRLSIGTNGTFSGPM